MIKVKTVEYYNIRFGSLEGYNQRKMKIVKLMDSSKQSFRSRKMWAKDA